MISPLSKTKRLNAALINLSNVHMLVSKYSNVRDRYFVSYLSQNWLSKFIFILNELILNFNYHDNLMLIIYRVLVLYTSTYRNTHSYILTLFCNRYCWLYEYCLVYYQCTNNTVRVHRNEIIIQELGSVATKYSTKYLVRVLFEFLKNVFSMSTLRGTFLKYLV